MVVGREPHLCCTATEDGSTSLLLESMYKVTPSPAAVLSQTTSICKIHGMRSDWAMCDVHIPRNTAQSCRVASLSLSKEYVGAGIDEGMPSRDSSFCWPNLVLVGHGCELGRTSRASHAQVETMNPAHRAAADVWVLKLLRGGPAVGAQDGRRRRPLRIVENPSQSLMV